ncbi:MAG: hypothetical protein IBX55_22555 [Methyloprofundus sp.]|nr:hypothetical protein [Methyloprofundus sp.]
MAQDKPRHNPKKMTPKQMVEKRMRNSVKFDTEGVVNLDKLDNALEKLIYERVYKYGSTDYIEAQSNDFESNLLTHFYKLASIENYRNNNAREDEAKSLQPEDYLSSSLSESPHMKVVKSIVEEYQSDWEQFLLNNLFQQQAKANNSSEKPETPENSEKMDALGMSQEEVDMGFAIYKAQNQFASPEDYKSSVNYKRDKNTKLKIFEERVLAATAPELDQTWKSKNLLDFSAACFDNALELGVIALSAYRMGDTNLAWLALMKAREFLGTFVGARVNVVKGTNRAIQGLTSSLARQRTVDFARSSVLIKMKQILNATQHNQFFKDEATWDNADLGIKAREGYLIDDLVENVLLPVYKEARGLEITPLPDDDSSDRMSKVIEEWITHDPEFTDVFADLSSKLLKDRHFYAQKLLDVTKLDDSESKGEESHIKIDRSKFRELIVELETHWDSYDARFMGCPADNDCAYKKQEDKRLKELRGFFNKLFELDKK